MRDTQKSDEDVAQNVTLFYFIVFLNKTNNDVLFNINYDY